MQQLRHQAALTRAAVFGADMHFRDAAGAFKIKEALRVPRADEQFRARRGFRNVIDRRQAAAAADQHRLAARRQRHRRAVRAAHIDGRPGGQIAEFFRDAAAPLNRERQRRVVQHGEGLFADARQPREDELAGQNRKVAVKDEQRQIRRKPPIFKQFAGRETDIGRFQQRGRGVRVLFEIALQRGEIRPQFGSRQAG